MHARLWLVFVMLAVLMCPDVALADDSLVDSFGRGFDSLMGNGTNESVTPEKDFIESYEPQEVVLSAPATREYDEESTTVDFVNGTLDSFNTVPWRGGNYSLFQSVRLLLGAHMSSPVSQYFLLPAIGLVFMWWGVRKCVNMIMGAWRKGHQSV